MDENEEMEKDLAKDRKFEAVILENIKDLEKGQTTISTEGFEVTNFGEQYTIKYKGITFGIIEKNGEFTYNKDNLRKVIEVLKKEGKDLDDLGLPELEQSIDQEKESQPENSNDEEEQITEEQEKEDEEETEKNIEEDKEKIADELGIDVKKIYPIREDSAFYKNHPGMFPNKDLFFFEDNQGKIKVGTRDEKGKPIEDTVHFSTKEVGQMEPVIRLGDGRKDSRKEIPLQTITIKNPAKENGEEDVQDRYIAVFRGNGGYLEFEEVEQSRETGKAVAERIEVSGREYNTKDMNERTNNRSGGQTPGETSKNYESIENSLRGNNGVQPEETETKTYIEQIKQDIIRQYGPKDEKTLEEMANGVMERIEEYGEKRDEAIARVGIQERDKDGRSRGETLTDPRRG